MSTSASPRFTTRQTGWIALAVFGGWVAFLFLPSRTPPKPTGLDLPPVRAQSKLEAVGLRENVDWAGLPDLFAVWAERVVWDHDTVTFGYWHPGSRRYAYVIEARRGRDGVRFRALPEEEARPYEHLVTEMIADGTQADTHPFLFLFERATADSITAPLPKPVGPANPGVPLRAPVDLKPTPILPVPRLVPQTDVH